MRHPASGLQNILVALTLVAALARGACAQPLAALVTDAYGKVEVKRPASAWAAASVMTEVPAGSELRVAAGASARLSFVRGGLKVVLNGPALALVDADGAHVVQGAATSARSTRPNGRTAVALPGDVNVSKMGGSLVRGSDDIVVISGPTVLRPQLTLRWRNGADTSDGALNNVFNQYEVRIEEGGNKGAPLVTASVAGNLRSFAVPGGTLAAGRTYTVTVTGTPSVGVDPSTATQDITVLDVSAATQVEAATSEGMADYQRDPSDVSPLVALTWIYLDRRMYGDALELLERIVAVRPESVDACYVLYKLYKELGMTGKAMELETRAGIKTH